MDVSFDSGWKSQEHERQALGGSIQTSRPDKLRHIRRGAKDESGQGSRGAGEESLGNVRQGQGREFQGKGSKAEATS